MARKNKTDEIFKTHRNMSSEEEDALIQKALTFLGEHFDAIVVLTARSNQDGTHTSSRSAKGHPLLTKALVEEADMKLRVGEEDDTEDEDDVE